MDKKSSSGKRRTISLREIKWLILTLGLTGTILLWNLFSKQMNQDTAASSTVAAIPTQPVAGLVLEFPPLPTLVSYVSQPVSVGVKQNTAPTPAPVAQPQVQVPVKVILSGAAPRAAAPAPVARTRSSH
jgi:hypothetical protein